MAGAGCAAAACVAGTGDRACPAVRPMDHDAAARLARIVRECQTCLDRAAVSSRAQRAGIARHLADRLEEPGSDVEAMLLQALLDSVAAAFESFDAGRCPPGEGRAEMRLAQLRRIFLARVGHAESGGNGTERPSLGNPPARGAPQVPLLPSNGEGRSAPVPARDDGAVLADRAARLIERDFACRRTVADLARALHCHPRRLQECFRLRHHTSVHRYLDRVRAAEAARLIGQAGLKVEAVALMIGLRSRKNLYALVRRTTGLTVGELRRAGGMVL